MVNGEGIYGELNKGNEAYLSSFREKPKE